MQLKNPYRLLLLPAVHFMAALIISPSLAAEKPLVSLTQPLTTPQPSSQSITPASKQSVTQKSATQSITPNSKKTANQADKRSSKIATKPKDDLPVSISSAQMAELTKLFSDVQPSAWYYESLKSLVERYGCISGYPNGTFQGQKYLTRSEFAAGLDACLNRINAEIKNRTANLVTRDQLAALFRILSSIFENNPNLRRSPGLDSTPPPNSPPPKQGDGTQPR